MSKGSKLRPIDKQSYDSNYDKIFGNKQISSIKIYDTSGRKPVKDIVSDDEFIKYWKDELDKEFLNGLNKTR